MHCSSNVTKPMSFIQHVTCACHSAQGLENGKYNPCTQKDDPTLPDNYRPISLLCVLSKVFERCILNHCLPHLSDILSNMQYGFQRGRSTGTQLLQVYHHNLSNLAQGKEVDAIYLDLSRAFDKVPHNLLITKLSSYGISGNLLMWYHSYLSDRYQRVVLDGVFSSWLPVTSGVPEGSILGPLLFLVFVDDLPDYIGNGSQLHALFADDSKLYSILDTPNSALLLQQDLNSLVTWSVTSNMTFRPSKCKTLHISKKKNPINARSYYLGNQSLESVPQVKDLGITISDKLQ